LKADLAVEGEIEEKGVGERRGEHDSEGSESRRKHVALGSWA